MAKLIINDTTLSAIGDALRYQTGTTESIKPADMAPMILSLKTDGIPPDAFILTGNCNYRFFANNWSWLIIEYNHKMHSENITNMAATFLSCKGFDDLGFELNIVDGANCNQAFDGCEIKVMPVINGKIGTGKWMFQDSSIETATDYECDTTTTFDYSYMFYNAKNLQALPYLTNCRPSDCTSIFYHCDSITEIPEDYFETWQVSESASIPNMFAYCVSLRKAPTKALKDLFTGLSYTYYYCLFPYCYALDELVSIPVINAVNTLNGFSRAFNDCYRLKSVTFETEEDGTAKTANWQNQTIDLSTVGFDPNNKLPLVPSGDFTYLNCVDNSTSYDTLKNAGDWWTSYYQYSRYNLNSAVETINSLPITSGNNTIKFKSDAGSGTDGGAIYLMTEEQIAVAVDKGWTVSFV